MRLLLLLVYFPFNYGYVMGIVSAVLSDQIWSEMVVAIHSVRQFKTSVGSGIDADRTEKEKLSFRWRITG